MSKLFSSEQHPFTQVLQRELTGQCISEVSREQPGYGVTWWESRP